MPSFDQSVAFLPEAARDETMLATNQFEIVAQGRISALTNPASTVVLRELQAQQVNGGWVKTYVFADGHSEVRREADGNFGTWEAQHIFQPGALKQ